MDAVPKYLPLSGVTTRLGYKDARSTVRFLRNHGVGIFRHAGTRLQYVLKCEFEAALLVAAIAYLQAKYGNRWEEMLEMCRREDMGGLINAYKYIQKKSEKTNKALDFISENANRFMSSLQFSISQL